jgi:hypothetical protein
MARKDRNKHIRRRSGVPLRSGVNLAKLRILSETMIPVPGYSDLFLGDLPSLQEVLKVLPREIWTDALSQIAGFLANPVLDTTSINSIVIDALGPNLRFMAQKLLNENPRSHLLYLFPVLVALELAYVHAPVQVDGWDKDDTNYHIFRAIYLVHELLSERTHVLVESDPAGVIAGIIERSYCGRPANMAIRGYGIWRWQHAHIDDDIVQRRLMFDAALRRERGIGIADLVAICSLVQLTCTGKASMGLFATRHRISSSPLKKRTQRPHLMV